jgi:hypothetical protein
VRGFTPSIPKSKNTPKLTISGVKVSTEEFIENALKNSIRMDLDEDHRQYVAARATLTPEQAENLPKIKRTARYELRLTSEELNRWKTHARNNGKNLSDWIRSNVGLGAAESHIKKIRQPKHNTPKTDPEVIRELAKIGNNLNQIARALNICAKDGTPVQTIEVIMLLNSIGSDLRRVLPELPESPSKTRKTPINANGEQIEGGSDAHQIP